VPSEELVLLGRWSPTQFEYLKNTCVHFELVMGIMNNLSYTDCLLIKCSHKLLVRMYERADMGT